jgi:hypothetical protein
MKDNSVSGEMTKRLHTTQIKSCCKTTGCSDSLTGVHRRGNLRRHRRQQHSHSMYSGWEHIHYPYNEPVFASSFSTSQKADDRRADD